MVHLTVPLDHTMVVQPRSGEYIYRGVEQLLLHHLSHMQRFLAEIAPWLYGDGLRTLPAEQIDDVTPYWNNGYFAGDDARSAYAIACRYRPSKIVEIGSGNSTKFFRRAIQDIGSMTELISIDPEPRAEVKQIANKIIEKSVLDVGLEVFSDLERNDILFMDGSHLVFNGTDTTHFFLEILPVVRKGVLVHIHDIMLPWEYDEEFTRRGYNEQQMLATLLLNSEQWKPLLPVRFMHRRGLLPEGGVSFWLCRSPGPLRDGIG